MKSRFWVILLASLFLVFAGCSGDDLGSGENGQNDGANSETPDVGGDDDAEEETDDVGGGDEDAGDTGDVGQGDADVDENGAEECNFENVDPVECAYPSLDGSCPTGDFGPAAFITHLQVVEDQTCCADLDDPPNGEVNNIIGTIIGSLSFPGFPDVNQGLIDAIEDGNMAYLFETANWDHPLWSPGFDLWIHEATATDHTMAENIAGDGSFYLAPWSVVQGTDVRRYGFDSAQICDGEFRAEGGSFQIRFPGLIEAIDARMERMSIRASVVQSPPPDLTAGGGFSLISGEMGGAILRDVLFESMNEAAMDCACFGNTEGMDVADGPIFYFEPPSDRWYCGLKQEVVTECQSAPIECQGLASYDICQSLAGISGSADVEVEGKRAFSIGLHFEAITTEIVGIDE